MVFNILISEENKRMILETMKKSSKASIRLSSKVFSTKLHLSYKNSKMYKSLESYIAFELNSRVKLPNASGIDINIELAEESGGVGFDTESAEVLGSNYELEA